MSRKFLFENYIAELTEPDDVDLSSFDLKTELCPEFWKDGKLVPLVRKELLEITKDVIEDFDIKGMEFEDIVITGSIANYNWNEEYSDIDLHIIVNFSSINNDVELVKKYFDVFRKNWNDTHDEISIYGYPVEIYIQDSDEQHTSTGVYSIMNNDWVVKPEPNKLSKDDIDEENIKQKVSEFMNEIDDLQDEFDDEDADYEEILYDAEDLFDEIKNTRKSSMRNSSEMTDGNLIFKALRRNGYIEKLLDIRTECYDKTHSIE